VRGDAFIARIFDNEDHFKRLDFELSEMNSSAGGCGTVVEKEK
jgi:hypothetical protein